MTKAAKKASRKRVVTRRKPARRKREATAPRAAEARRKPEASLKRATVSATPRTRLELDPDDMQRSLMRLLLSLAGFVRDLLERQTLRRLERKTLSAAEVERLGRALMQLEQTIEDLARSFDLDPEELNLGLGPLGRLR